MQVLRVSRAAAIGVVVVFTGIVGLTVGVATIHTQGRTDRTFKEPAEFITEEWTRPFPPFRIVGNVYWVGTYDLSSYLITTPQGNILINTGVTSSVPMIRSNIETLGFKLADTKILLATHGHFDHVAGMAELKRLTGARLLMHEGDVPILEDGGKTDFAFGQQYGVMFEPVKVDQALKDGDKVGLAGIELIAHHHPGHTKGATSFSFTTTDSGRSYRVVIANMGTINAGVTLLNNPRYPAIAQDYARTFAAQKAMPVEIFLASHAGQFRLHEKYKPGDAHNPARFIDPEGFRTLVEEREKIYRDQLARERNQPQP